MTGATTSLRELAEPSLRGDRIKVVVERVARLTGLSYWRTYDIWYDRARRVEQFEIDQIEEALNKKRTEDARREIHNLRTRLTRLESLLVLSDQDFHRPTISALRSSDGGLIRTDRPLDKGTMK